MVAYASLSECGVLTFRRRWTTSMAGLSYAGRVGVVQMAQKASKSSHSPTSPQTTSCEPHVEAGQLSDAAAAKETWGG